MRKKSNILYKLFIKDKGSDFRTLLALLNGEKFYNNDKMLLNEIIEIDQKLERLIIEKSGYIENSNLSELLSKAAIHFNIMYQAYNGTLSGEVERFKEYIYPRELDEELNREVTKLKNRMRKLNKC